MPTKSLQWLRSSSLINRNAPLTSIWQIIGWWEARRLIFNLIIGATGTITCIAILAIAVISDYVFGIPVGMPDPPIFAFAGIIIYGVMANVCYTGGWVTELIVKKTWPDQSEQFGALSFTLGLVFAVIITLSPIALLGAAALFIGVAKLAGFQI